MDTVIVFPEPGNLKKIARELTDLADRPLDVEYVMWPEPGFRISQELYAKFSAARGDEVRPDVEEVEEAEETVEVTEAAEEPVKRKPGRPKKVQEGDNAN